MLLWMCITAIILSGCGNGAPNFPKSAKVYSPFFNLKDAKGNPIPPVCVEFEIVDESKIKIEPTGEIFPVDHCDKMFGFLPEDQVKVNKWARDMQKWAKKKCN